MATRSYIGIKTDEKKVYSFYCHWDGYPSHQLPYLNKVTDVKAFIEKGDRSSIDGGYYGTPAKEFDLEEWLKDNMVNFKYLFTDKWEIYDTNGRVSEVQQ